MFSRWLLMAGCGPWPIRKSESSIVSKREPGALLSSPLSVSVSPLSLSMSRPPRPLSQSVSPNRPPLASQTPTVVEPPQVGCAYNFCWYHDSLRLAAPENAPRKWQERTPAMAAGLTDHRWTLRELLLLKVPRPPWVASKRRGRPPKLKPQPAMAMAA